jgi:hypothetical protein
MKNIEILVKDLWFLGLDRKIRVIITKMGKNIAALDLKVYLSFKYECKLPAVFMLPSSKTLLKTFFSSVLIKNLLLGFDYTVNYCREGVGSFIRA